jgi:hypothetical protein
VAEFLGVWSVIKFVRLNFDIKTKCDVGKRTICVVGCSLQYVFPSRISGTRSVLRTRTDGLFADVWAQGTAAGPTTQGAPSPGVAGSNQPELTLSFFTRQFFLTESALLRITRSS